MRVEFKITRFKELERALAEEMPKTTARNVLNRTAKEAMGRIETRMAQLAPYDPQDRDEDGNHLNETMTTKPMTARQLRQYGGITRKEGVGVLTGPAPVGKRARSNAGWQEDGTVKMPANPYARPAADSEGEAVIGDVRGILVGQIDRAKKRIARKAAKGK